MFLGDLPIFCFDGIHAYEYNDEMSHNELPTQILRQPPSRSRLADIRASLQHAQAVAEREWEQERGAAPRDAVPRSR